MMTNERIRELWNARKPVVRCGARATDFIIVGMTPEEEEEVRSLTTAHMPTPDDVWAHLLARTK